MKNRNIENLPNVMKLSELATYLHYTPLAIKKMIKRGTFFIQHFRRNEKERSMYVFKKKDVIKALKEL